MRRPLVWILTGLLTVSMTICAVTALPNVDKALARQLELVAEEPGAASGHNDLGNLLLLAGRYEEAEEAYRRAIELDPGDTGPRFNLGVLQQQMGKNRAASETYRELLERAPQHAWANYQLGVLLAERGQREQAIDRYARAFAADPSLTFAQYNPHIIDNPLATEALLRAEKYDLPVGTAVPRQYSAPERIAEWMLGQETLPEAVEAAQGAGSASPDTTRNPVFTPSQDEPVPRADGSQPDAPPPGRTLTADDLETSSVGQASAGRGSTSRRYSPGSTLRSRTLGGTPSTPPTSRSRTQPTATDRESASSRLRSSQIGSSPRPSRIPTGDAASPGSTLRRTYPSSRLSTGRLDLELLPPSAPPERLAQKDVPGAGGAS